MSITNARGIDPDTGKAWEEPTIRITSDEKILKMMGTGDMICTDGCGDIEDDGVCEHGHASLALWAGLI